MKPLKFEMLKDKQKDLCWLLQDLKTLDKEIGVCAREYIEVRRKVYGEGRKHFMKHDKNLILKDLMVLHQDRRALEAKIRLEKERIAYTETLRGAFRRGPT